MLSCRPTGIESAIFVQQNERNREFNIAGSAAAAAAVHWLTATISSAGNATAQNLPLRYSKVGLTPARLAARPAHQLGVVSLCATSSGAWSSACYAITLT